MYISVGIASPRTFVPLQKRSRTETDLTTGHKLFLAILAILLVAFLASRVLAVDAGVEVGGSRVETRTETDTPSPVSANVDLADESREPATNPVPEAASLPKTSPYAGEGLAISGGGSVQLPK